MVSDRISLNLVDQFVWLEASASDIFQPYKVFTTFRFPIEKATILKDVFGKI